MRVLQVTAIPITALRFVAPLAIALRETGHEVEFASGPGTGLDELEALGFLVHRLPITRQLFAPRNLHSVGALRTIMSSGGFDVVHAHTPVAAAVARAAARRLELRVAYTMHGSAWGTGVPRWQRRLFTAIERRQGRWTDLIFAVNPEDGADCLRLAGLPQRSVRILPAGGAGVAPDFFLDEDESERLRNLTRRRLGLAAGASVVVYVGRTVAAKGMNTLARAFRLIADAEQEAYLLVVGGRLEGERGTYSRERFGRAVGEQAAAHVLWQGIRGRVAPFIAAADVLVLPSRREGFGLTLAEAGALGRPVVATDTRGARAVVDPGVTGYLVPVDDADALAARALELLRDRGLAMRIGAAGRRRTAERFRREAVLAAYLEGYEELEGRMAASRT
jgi:glycosyltransferase involved in cell wall biosynthesis